MRTISLIVIHCSATKVNQKVTVEDIDRWHKARKWKGCGYHYVIYQDGSIHKGRPLEQKGAHVENHNAHSIGICYIGGLDQSGKPKDTRTPAQQEAMLKLLQELKTKYPNALITSHHTFNPQKTCPCFNAEKEYEHI